MIKNYQIGADIECFLRDKTTGEIVSAEGIVKGTKHQPFNFDPSNKFYATSLDNVMAEHCIPPVTRSEDFVAGILKAKDYLEHLDERLCTAYIPCTRMDQKYLETQNAQLFGCEPDFNAWQWGMENPRPTSAISNLRTAGFHVHVGYENPNADTNIDFMKWFDLYVTLPGLLMEPDNERRELYGKAGAFRHKEYGLESRTLSSFFASTPELMKWVYDQTEVAIAMYNEHKYLDGNTNEILPDIINNAEKDRAARLCEEFNINHLMSA